MEEKEKKGRAFGNGGGGATTTTTRMATITAKERSGGGGTHATGLHRTTSGSTGGVGVGGD